MSCCSGSTQTHQMSVLIIFRPQLDQQFQLKIILRGRNGVWKGRGKGTFDFGSEIHCGNKPPLGLQDVSFKFELKCLEGNDLIMTGTMDIHVAKIINRFTLPAVVMDCPHGGPGCLVQWPYLFLNEYLGNCSIEMRGVKNG